MRQEVKSILWIAPIVAIAAAGILYFSFQVPRAQKPTAPDISVTTLDGKEISLAGLRGKPLFLNFWSSW